MDMIIRQLKKLNFGSLEVGWVQGIYESEFLNSIELPAEYEATIDSLDLYAFLRRTLEKFDIWAAQEDEERSWTQLSQNLEYKKLIALLFHLIDYGSKNVFTAEYRTQAILSARVYYKLLSIPGYNAYSIYHPQIFTRSLGCLSFPKVMCEEDSEYSSKDLTRELNSVNKQLTPFVMDLQQVVMNMDLKPSDINFEEILNNLMEITGAAVANKLNIDKMELTVISGVAYKIIDILLNDKEGNPIPAAIKVLYKCLLPKLLSDSFDCKVSNALLRASYVTFSGLLLSRYGKAALSGFTILLQHLCFSTEGVEREKVRQSRVSLVVGLMTLLPKKQHKTFVKWIIQLTKTAKAPHRHLALEILSKLLSNEPDADEIAIEANRIKNSNNVKSVGAGSDSTQTNKSTEKHNVNENSDDSQVNNVTANNNATPCKEKEPDTSPNIQETSSDTSSKNNNVNMQSSANTDKTLTSEQVSTSINESDKQTGIRDTVRDASANDANSAEDLPSAGLEDLPLAGMEDLPSAGLEDLPSAGLEESGTDASMSNVTMLGIEDFIMNEVIVSTETDDIFVSLNDNTVENTNIQEQKKNVDNSTEILNSPTGDIFVPINNNTVVNTNKEEQHSKDGDNSTYVLNAENTENAVASTDEVNTSQTVSEKLSVNIINEDSQDSQSSQDSQDQWDIEDDAPLITACVHTVPHKTILYAVYDRAFDASSTVRTRALNFLTECIKSDQEPVIQAIRALNGDPEHPKLIALAISNVSSERAIVRRSAVTLVDVLLTHHPCFINNNNLGVLVSLCRDASVTVRTAAITALGDLMLKHPQPATFDAFLAGPLHQLSDPEVKIQELVVSVVQRVLLAPLKARVPGLRPQGAPSLPWHFLAAVTRQNKRRHLQKCCAMLATTSSSISHRVVDVVSTHLGEGGEVALQCLVLLSSVARHLAYSEVDFMLDYYYQLTDEPQSHDARLLPLVLEVLSEWSEFITGEKRVKLRTHLISGLNEGTFCDSGRRSCALLAAHLDRKNIQWASELLQACERRALEGAPLAEWVAASDVALVAPEPPSAALVHLYIQAATEPNPEVSVELRGCVTAGLGRLCLRSRAVAAAAAPALARAMASALAPLCVRVNALLALADICTRYTCIVEPHLGEVCACVESGPEQLRRAAARALTRLLLAGFLRLRAPLYFRYCALLAESDREVREPVEYYVSSCLTADKIFQLFVDTLLYYNGCSGHPLIGLEAEDSEDEEVPPCYHFPSVPLRTIDFNSRQLIYDVMLQRTSVGQRMGVQCRLAREVLAHAAEQCDEGPLPPALEHALLDAIVVLRGPHMRLPKKPATSEVTDIDDLTARVTTNIVSQKMKRTVAEVVIPAVLRLYARVSRCGGQLTAYLVQLASDLLTEYREEVRELIDNDPDLMTQIAKFQEEIGDEQTFGNRLNLVIRDNTDVEATPSMTVAGRKRRAVNKRRPPPAKRSLRM